MSVLELLGARDSLGVEQTRECFLFSFERCKLAINPRGGEDIFVLVYSVWN